MKIEVQEMTVETETIRAAEEAAVMTELQETAETEMTEVQELKDLVRKDRPHWFSDSGR